MDIDDLKSLAGPGFDLEAFKEEVPMIGASVEKVEGREVGIEFFPSRPDLFCVEGIARAYRRFSGIDRSPMLERMKVEGPSKITVDVDPGLIGIRPVIGCALVENVKLDQNALISIMNLQEKLHLTIGRKRKKVAIGIHDVSPLVPPFRYRAVHPKEVEFVPLQKQGDWDLERILRYHEKGKDYAWVLDNLDRYPVIMDSQDQVLSFPPIINGELTKVTEDTENIFIDCTGLDVRAVSQCVNIISSQLLERGGLLRSVKVVRPKGSEWEALGLSGGLWPDFRWKERVLDLGLTRRWLGKDISPEEASEALFRMGYEGMVSEGSLLRCQSPPWRGDILHQTDIIEDVAIGYGYGRFEGVGSRVQTTGRERAIRTLSSMVRESLIGMGYLEIMTLSLTNEDAQFRMMGRAERTLPKVQNPISVEHTMLRVSAVPSILQVLRSNKHRDLPQNLFEVADVQVGNLDRKVLGVVSVDTKASFTEVKGKVQRLLQDLQVVFDVAPADLGCYIRGRAASITVHKDVLGKRQKYDGPFPELSGTEGIPLGHMGELHPSLIAEMELASPASAFELDLDLLLSVREHFLVH
jgi:phenylalanyl-tRNA synthetase beta chain